MLRYQKCKAVVKRDSDSQVESNYGLVFREMKEKKEQRSGEMS
jgi:hypothetical protein